MNPRERRARAAQAVRDKFMGKPLIIGKYDCVKMVRFNLVKMGVQKHLPPAVRWSSSASGLRRMAEQGHGSLIEALDAVPALLPTAPARLWPGDVLALQAREDDPFGAALFVALGNRKFLGWGEGSSTCGIITPRAFVKAWRVPHV